jgi:hypothetical protein
LWWRSWSSRSCMLEWVSEWVSEWVRATLQDYKQAWRTFLALARWKLFSVFCNLKTSRELSDAKACEARSNRQAGSRRGIGSKRRGEGWRRLMESHHGETGCSSVGVLTHSLTHCLMTDSTSSSSLATIVDLSISTSISTTPLYL